MPYSQRTKLNNVPSTSTVAPNPQAPRVQEADDDLFLDLRFLEWKAAEVDVGAEEEVSFRGGGDGQVNEILPLVQPDQAVHGRGVG